VSVSQLAGASRIIIIFGSFFRCCFLPYVPAVGQTVRHHHFVDLGDLEGGIGAAEVVTPAL